MRLNGADVCVLLDTVEGLEDMVQLNTGMHDPISYICVAEVHTPVHGGGMQTRLVTLQVDMQSDRTHGCWKAQAVWDVLRFTTHYFRKSVSWFAQAPGLIQLDASYRIVGGLSALCGTGKTPDEIQREMDRSVARGSAFLRDFEKHKHSQNANRLQQQLT